MKTIDQRRQLLLDSLRDLGDLRITPTLPVLCAPFGDDLGKFGFRRVDWAPYIWIGTTPLPKDHPLFLENRVFSIGLASVLACLQLDLRPGDTLLDMCAAPGIKSLYLQIIHDKKIELYVNDISHARLVRLRALFERFDISLPVFSNQDGQSLVRRYGEGYFDAIIVDAPCSGEGNILKADQEALKTWSPAKVKRLASLQYKLLRTAQQLLKPAGQLIYATCTLNQHENEIVIQKSRAGTGLQTTTARITELESYHLRTGEAIKLLPSEQSIGFFVAKVK